MDETSAVLIIHYSFVLSMILRAVTDYAFMQLFPVEVKGTLAPSIDSHL